VGFREKDTAIILFCCILLVLLVIFFLSERRKFTLNNIDSSPEGAHDIYTLSARIYKLGRGSFPDRKRQLISSRNIQIERTLLYLGVDRKGEMLVQVSSPFPSEKRTFRASLVKPIDLSIDFLPENSIHFPFFDGDLIKYRGEIVRRGEEWKYIRSLSLYGEKEFNTEIRYIFREKVKRRNLSLARIEFETAAKKWIDNGLNCINRFSGNIWIDDATGKVEEVSYHFNKISEHSSYFIEVDLERLRSGILTGNQLENVRERFDQVKKSQVTNKVRKKKVVPMHAKGNGKDLTRNLFPPSGGDMYTVQVRAFSGNAHGKKTAAELRDALAAKGYIAFIIKDSNMYKVCIGKFPSREDTVLNKRHSLMQHFFKDAFIRKVP